MEDKLDLIVLQNWILLALLLGLLANTIFFNLRNRRMLTKEVSFSNLWESDKIEELLSESDAILNRYPNRVDAIYYRARALRKIGNDEKALEYFQRLANVDPSFREEAERQIHDIQSKNTANK